MNKLFVNFLASVLSLFTSIASAQTIAEVNAARKKDSAIFSADINSLKNSYIDFDPGFIVSGTKVTNIATPSLLDSIRRKLYSNVTPANNISQSLIDSIRVYFAAQNAFVDSIKKLRTDVSAMAVKILGYDTALQRLSGINTTIGTLQTANSKYDAKFRATDSLLTLHTGQINTSIGNDQSFLTKIADTSKAIRLDIASISQKYTQLNTTVWQNNINQQRTNDTLRNNISTLTSGLNDQQGALQTIKTTVATLVTDVDKCKAYDALLEKTIFTLPKRP